MRNKIICKKTIDFGMVDYLHQGRKNCRVTVELELRENENGLPEFSACGNIWNVRETDIYCGGQCLDTIAEYVHDPRMQEILRLWKLYHLNGMHAECEHQRALGWIEQAREEVTLYHYKLRREVWDEKQSIENAALSTIRKGSPFVPTPEQTKILSLGYWLHTYEPVTGELAELYEPDKNGIHGATERQTRGWIRYEDAPEVGLLGKPCPVCGYRRGHGWRYMPIPDDDLASIKRLCGMEA